MNRTLAAIGASALVFGCLHTAQAGWLDEGIGAYNRPGPYLSLGGGAVLEDFDIDSGGGVNFNSESGWQINPLVGYRLAPWAAVELEGKYFDGVKLELSSPLGSANGEVGGWATFGNLKLYAPWNHRIQPWIKGGVGLAQIEVSSGGIDANDKDLAWHGGIGVDFVVNDHFTVGVEGTRFQTEGDLDGFDFWTAGGFVTFRFGGIGGGDYAAR